MKKILLLLLLLVCGLTAHAQFAQGTKYIGASVSGLGISYSSNEKFRFGLDASAGYFAADCLMLRATVGYDHTREIDDVTLGGGLRYYFDNCGVFLGTGLEFQHHSPSNNNLMLPVEIGYAFFVNHFITIEPSVYYKMSLNDFSHDSTVGLKLGLGFYF